MSKHTAGKWIYVMLEGTNYARITLDTTGKDNLRGYCGEDNARLISAAPCLLEACKAMIEWDDREKDHAVDFYARMELCEHAFNLARAAIAKATGGEK